MSKDSLVKCYQNNKERLHRKSHEKYRSLSEEEKKNPDNWQYCVNDIKVFLKIKNQN